MGGFEADSDDLDDDFDDDDDSDESDLESVAGDSKALIAKLEADLEAAPFNAEFFAALISTLREAADLDKLRIVRRRAAGKVPLSEPLWFEWLQDEKSLADDADFEELDALHELACGACPLSSRIWLARCALRQSLPAAKMSAEDIRSVYEAALDILGLHPSEGPEIWAEYREYEEALLRELDGQPTYGQQVHRVRALYLRQLALPLPGLERLREIFASFESGLDESFRDPMVATKAEALMSGALEGWQQREAVEKRLLEASRPMVSLAAAGAVDAKGAEVSSELLALEEASGDPKRILLGHLRATHWAPADEQRWRCLVDFIAGTLQDPKKLVNALHGAVRNCPHSAEFWLRLHLERESAGADLTDLQNLIELGVEALQIAGAQEKAELSSAGIQELLLQHADSCRRAASTKSSDADSAQKCWTQMRATFERVAQISEKNKSDQGSSCQILLQWMRFEAYSARCNQNALDVGNRLVKMWGGYYNVWSAFIAAVRFCTGTAAYGVMRDLYFRAIGQVADYPAQIRNDHIQFERECGTLQSWREARDAEAVAQARDAEAVAQARDAEAVAQPAGGGADAVVSNASLSTGEVQSTEKKQTKKRVAANVSGHEKKKRRRAKQTQEAGDHEGSESMERNTNESGAVPKDASHVPVVKSENLPGSYKTSDVGIAATSEDKIPTVVGNVEPEPKENLSLDHSNNEQGQATKDADGAVPAVPKATLPTDVAEVESGAQVVKPTMAKVSSEDALSIEKPATLQTDTKLEAHQGSHYHQKRLAAGDNVPLQPEAEGDHTVYVSNLDWSVDEAQLRRIFDEIPGMRDVRLVRDFLKRSKGYAYIDFETSAQVKQAAKRLNGFTINKRAMFVARSLPTKPLFEERTIFVKNIGAIATESDVRDAFIPKGEILGVRLPLDDVTGAHKGYAYVEFSTAESTTAALTCTDIEIGGQKVHVARSIPMKDHRHQKAASRKDLPQRSNQRQIAQGQTERQDPVKLAEKFSTTVYVKNLAIQVDETKLRDHFAQCGEVQQVMICKNARGRSRGFGFVEFGSKDHAQAALTCNDSVLCGREIWVSKSQRAITQKGAKGGIIDDKGTDVVQEGKVEAYVAVGKRRLDLGDQGKPENVANVADVAKKKKLVTGEPAPFRSAKGKHGGPDVGNAAAVGEKPHDETETAIDTAASAKPLSNADFRAMLLKS